RGLEGGRPAALALDGNGDVLVTGAAEGRFLPLKYDPAGNLLWEAREEGYPEEAGGAGRIAVGPQGDVVVTGSFRSFQVRSDIVTVKYDPAGNRLWSSRFGGGNGKEDQGAGRGSRARRKGLL